MALTELKIKKAKPTTKPSKLSDGGNLVLVDRPTGSRTWKQRMLLTATVLVLLVSLKTVGAISEPSA